MTKLRDRTGETIAEFTVLGRGPDLVIPRRRVQWLCRCSCGKEVLVEAANLNTGHTKTCGHSRAELCAEVGKRNRTHGMKGSREMYAWASAKGRCFNDKVSSYKYYGGRGITMCGRWADSFTNFYGDMGPCPPNYTLDRIDTNGHYEPGNCRWATRSQQQRNRRNSVMISTGGKPVPMYDAAELAGLSGRLVYERVTRQNWSVSSALSTPKRKRKS